MSSSPLNRYSVSRAALAVGVFGASYISVKVPRIPVVLNGAFLLSMTLAFCALACVFSTRPPGSRVLLPASAVVFAGSWFFIALANQEARTPRDMVAYALAITFVPLVAFLSVAVIGSSTSGRLCILEGFSIGGILAGVLGIVETAIHRSPIHEFGISVGAVFEYLPERFGFHRAEGAFSHPILLAGFLGLSMLATLELVRVGRLRLALGIPILVLQFVGILSTVSRGPLLAILCILALWAIFASSLQVRRRLALALPVLLILAIGLAQANIGDLGSFVQATPSNPSGDATYRAGLYREAVAALPAATAFGNVHGEDATLGDRFRSLDSEPVNLLAHSGLAGLVVFTGAVVWAVGRTLTSKGRRRNAIVFTALGGLALLLIGASVAFFGLFVVYAFAFLGLLWSQAPAYREEAKPG